MLESTDGSVTGRSPALELITWIRPASPPGWLPRRGSRSRSVSVQCHNPAVLPRPHDPDPTATGMPCTGSMAASRRASSGLFAGWPDTGNYTGSACVPSGGRPLFESSDVVDVFRDPVSGPLGSHMEDSTAGARRGSGGVAGRSGRGKRSSTGLCLELTTSIQRPLRSYGMPVFAWQGLYWACHGSMRLSTISYGQYSVGKTARRSGEDPPRTIDVQLAWSWDLVSWNRPPERQPLIPRGRPDQLGQRNDRHRASSGRCRR
ncbi:MAG UNVERIFIED_CONTAM: hypothetical protein LVR18_40105 [Planctomycetaceae bacterium]|jgi:hypothetical protein